ncbi:MAG: tRNA (guanine-N1)-methyltransferase, partial [Symploca sp. SIO1A3]|nr:tRNA (guanine-N1)-methyltransferase [Symploca sp. SIO1A3]
CSSQVARDLAILSAAIYRSDIGSLRVLDAMTGCGVRPLRYWLESQADWVWANEANLEISSILQQNLGEAVGAGRCQVTYLDANRIFFDCYTRQDYYDLVDVDCFGSPNPYLSTSLWGTKIGGLLYLTSTDGRTATGHLPENSLRVYGAYARSHPAAHEQALRLLIGTVQQQAAMQGLGVEPVFSLFAGQTYRVMLRVLASQSLTAKNYGFLGYCHHCGNYQTVSWRQLGRVSCPNDQKALVISGPLWLGSLHEPQQLTRMISLAQEWHWLKRVQLLTIMAAEADFPPYFYTLGEIGRRGKMDIPKRSHLIGALQAMGYRASPTHINAQAIKTDADINTCIAAARHR